MALIAPSVPQSYIDDYHGFDIRDVGPGLLQPNIYHSDSYALKKTSHILMGCINDCYYSSFEIDRNPLIIPFQFEPQYQTILAFNIHYIPRKYRQALARYIIFSNRHRIESNLPLLIDYQRIKQRIPAVTGIVRRYKIVLLRVNGTVPLQQWPIAIKQHSRWQHIYKHGSDHKHHHFF